MILSVLILVPSPQLFINGVDTAKYIGKAILDDPQKIAKKMNQC